jgi:uncharacterized RDD family membrane protein YckC
LFCPACGTKALVGAEFCAKCGGRLPETVEPVSSSARSVSEPVAERLTGSGHDSMATPAIRFGGFWIRFAALLVDALLLLTILLLVLQFIVDPNLTKDYVEITAWYSIPLLFILYFPVMESSGLQGTLGKVAVGIKVVDAEGARINFLRAAWRMSAKLLSAIPLLIGFFRVGWTTRRQATHDAIASTFVVVRGVMPQQFTIQFPQLGKRPKWQGALLGIVCAAPPLAVLVLNLVSIRDQLAAADEPLLMGRGARPNE